jgi:2-alkenal reductase
MKPIVNKSLLTTIAALSLVALACVAALPVIQSQEAPAEPVEQAGAPPTLVSQGNPSVSILQSSELISQQEALISLYENASSGVVSIFVRTADGGGQGSGFVVDKDGHIVTNFHVVEGAQYMEVAFTSGLRVEGEVIGTDRDSDLAVVRVDVPQSELFPLALGDSGLLSVGQMVVAIGNPFGLSSTMTTGIVSGLGRTGNSLNPTGDGAFFASGDLIQTDAAINPGNSGGPLLNLNGEVVGINRSIQTFNVNAENEPVNSGVGFAVSVNILKRVVPSLIANGSYDYPYLGISSPTEISLELAQELGLDRTTGVLLSEVVADGPAEDAGLQIGDLIIAIDDFEVRTFGELISYLFTNASAGDTITMTFIRDGEEMQTDLTLGSR